MPTGHTPPRLRVMRETHKYEDVTPTIVVASKSDKPDVTAVAKGAKKENDVSGGAPKVVQYDDVTTEGQGPKYEDVDLEAPGRGQKSEGSEKNRGRARDYEEVEMGGSMRSASVDHELASNAASLVDSNDPFAHILASSVWSPLLTPRDSIVISDEVCEESAMGKVMKGKISLRDGVFAAAAVRIINEKAREKHADDLMGEAWMMSSLHHPNVVRLLGVVLRPDFLIVTELMPLGRMDNYLRTCAAPPGQHTLLSYAEQIAEALHYLHTQRIAHRDVCAKNVFLQSPSVVKLGDFSKARAVAGASTGAFRPSSDYSNLKWMAPEAIIYGRHGTKADVWSFGVFVWELFTRGARPYPNIRSSNVLEHLQMGGRLPRPVCATWTWDVMKLCWVFDDTLRPEMADLCARIKDGRMHPEKYELLYV
eukprot:Colp12_sorted_trinity150504_noHs@26496